MDSQKARDNLTKVGYRSVLRNRIFMVDVGHGVVTCFPVENGVITFGHDRIESLLRRAPEYRR